jgi:hypothetical protein
LQAVKFTNELKYDEVKYGGNHVAIERAVAQVASV